ncbi:hypothetical protein OC834_000432 [Tilletia horrida]|nr:hypothetical protein OC834_000432 [Tilletia horrida]
MFLVLQQIEAFDGQRPETFARPRKSPKMSTQAPVACSSDGLVELRALRAEVDDLSKKFSLSSSSLSLPATAMSTTCQARLPAVKRKPVPRVDHVVEYESSSARSSPRSSPEPPTISFSAAVPVSARTAAQTDLRRAASTASSPPLSASATASIGLTTTSPTRSSSLSWRQRLTGGWLDRDRGTTARPRTTGSKKVIGGSPLVISAPTSLTTTTAKMQYDPPVPLASTSTTSLSLTLAAPALSVPRRRLSTDASRLHISPPIAPLGRATSARGPATSTKHLKRNGCYVGVAVSHDDGSLLHSDWDTLEIETLDSSSSGCSQGSGSCNSSPGATPPAGLHHNHQWSFFSGWSSGNKGGYATVASKDADLGPHGTVIMTANNRREAYCFD